MNLSGVFLCIFDDLVMMMMPTFLFKKLFDTLHRFLHQSIIWLSPVIMFLTTVLWSCPLEYYTLNSFMTTTCGVLVLHMRGLFWDLGMKYVFLGKCFFHITFPPQPSSHYHSKPIKRENECAYNVCLGPELFSPMFIIC